MSVKATIGVTGAQGFVGRALTRDLRRKGYRLRLFGRVEGRTAEGDRIEALDDPALSFEGVDSLVHLAGIPTSKASDADLTRSNVDLTVEVARKAAAAGVRRFVFFSSLHIHGKSSETKIAPDAPHEPHNSYGRSKTAAEQALEAFRGTGGMRLVILRPPMIYGPGARGSFAALLRLVKSGLPLPFGAATTQRSFCSIGNLLSAVQASLDHPDPPPVLFPADPDDFSTRDLCVALRAATGSSSLLIPAPVWMVRGLLDLAGQREVGRSLFEPLLIDRSHWADWGWSPPESNALAIERAVQAE